MISSWKSKSYQLLCATHVMFSTLLEFQIAVGFGLACHGIARWTQLLRWMVLISFLFCALSQVIAHWLDLRNKSAFPFALALRVVHSLVAVTATFLTYLWAFCGARKAPLFARRRAIQRGASYAASSLLGLPWFVYQTYYFGRIDGEKLSSGAALALGSW